jgi:hypothetical protein
LIFLLCKVIFNQIRRVLRIVVMLKNNLATSEVQFLARKVHGLCLITFQYILIDCFIHIVINFAHPTGSSIGNGTPKHDTITTVFYSNLTCLGSSLSPSLIQAQTRPSELKRLILVSSDQTTRFQSSIVQSR